MPSIVRRLQTNFSSGELDPRMKGREDTTIYDNGAETLLNSSPLVQGGIRRRPGTKYLATLAGHTRLEKLQFNEAQLYIFAFSNARLDIFDEDGAAVGSAFTSQPWNATTMWEMRLAQAGDTTIIVHEDFMMQKLLRTGATTFTIADYAFEAHSTGYPRYQPYYKFADNAVTLTPSATTGSSITLTTSAAYWIDGYHDHADHPAVIRYGTAADNRKEIDIVSVTNTTVAVGNVREELAGTSADTNWDENVFNAQNGFARSTAFHGNRLWFGGSRDLPRHAFSSHSGAYFNFNVGTGADDQSIQAEVGINEIGEIRHTHSGRHLQFYSDTGVTYVPESDAAPVTPDSFNPRFQVPYGVSTKVVPQRLDGATIFMQDTNKVARELLFSDIEQAYTGNAISLVSNDMLAGVSDMAVLYGHIGGPEQFAVVVNSNGSISCYHSIRSEKIAGWYPWQTTGTFESVVNLNNVLYTAVKRTSGGSTVYYLEQFDFDLSLDAAKSFDTSTTVAATNGTFDSDTGWTKGTGWTISGGTATCSGAQSAYSSLSQNVASVADSKTYRVEFTLSNVTAGTIQPKVGGTNGTAGYTESSAGTYTQDITMPGSGTSTTNALDFIANASFAGSIDNVTITEVASSFTAAHLVSLTVDGVTNDRVTHLGQVTSNGSGVAAFTDAYSKADVGLDFTRTIKTLPPNIQTPQGLETGSMKRVGTVVLQTYNSVAFSVSGYEFLVRQAGDDFSTPVTAQTGRFQFNLLGWSREGSITITQSAPLDFTLLGIWKEVWV